MAKGRGGSQKIKSWNSIFILVMNFSLNSAFKWSPSPTGRQFWLFGCVPDWNEWFAFGLSDDSLILFMCVGAGQQDCGHSGSGLPSSGPICRYTASQCRKKHKYRGKRPLSCVDPNCLVFVCMVAVDSFCALCIFHTRINACIICMVCSLLYVTDVASVSLLSCAGRCM